MSIIPEISRWNTGWCQTKTSPNTGFNQTYPTWTNKLQKLKPRKNEFQGGERTIQLIHQLLAGQSWNSSCKVEESVMEKISSTVGVNLMEVMFGIFLTLLIRNR